MNKGQEMKMVEIPLVSLQTSLEYWREQEAKYDEMGDVFIDLKAWAGIRADVYETLIEMYAN